MKVYIATAYGFDTTSFIIAANNEQEAHTLANNADMGTVSFEDIRDVPELSTTLINPEIISEF